MTHTCLAGLLPDPFADADATETPRAAQRAAAANVRWPNGHAITVGFTGPSFEPMGGRVLRALLEAATTWSQYANLTWRVWPWIPPAEPAPDILVNLWPTLAPYGTYAAYLGTENRTFAATGRPSVHLVFDPTDTANDDAELLRVCLHELGHVLGLIHEHERPDRPIVWDEAAVYRYYGRLTGWSQAEIHAQVIAPYEQPLSFATRFDPASIMMYPVPPGLARYDDGRPFTVGWNTVLSDRDKAMAGAMYPFPAEPETAA